MRPAFPASDYYGASAPPGAVSRRRACPSSALAARGEGDTGWFPRSSSVDRRVRRPALPLRYRHGYAADIHRGLPAGNHMATKEFSTTRRQWMRTATSPYPPDLSWWAVKGRQSLVSHVHLPVSLTGPASSGSADTSRRCQGCSHPPRHLPDQAAPSFTRPLRRPGGEGLSPPLDFRRLVAHMVLSPVVSDEKHPQQLPPDSPTRSQHPETPAT
jgi:hypothetical protein